MKSVALWLLLTILLVTNFAVAIPQIAHSWEWVRTVVKPAGFTMTAESMGSRYIEVETLRTNRIFVRRIEIGKFLELLTDKLVENKTLEAEELEYLIEESSIELVPMEVGTVVEGVE